ncbi:MAG: hypothetical protein E6R03_16670 [Hyphomicrobiaceae bacterium]|nr:MAG: hypothetical protein E6R03_16670 [Hyphomicrobiaceae bacterium]
MSELSAAVAIHPVMLWGGMVTLVAGVLGLVGLAVRTGREIQRVENLADGAAKTASDAIAKAVLLQMQHQEMEKEFLTNLTGFVKSPQLEAVETRLTAQQKGILDSMQYLNSRFDEVFSLIVKQLGAKS